MSGNVWEWTLSAYDPEHDGNLKSDSPRVLRGGSWSANRNFAKSSSRLYGDPADRSHSVGFRLVSPVLSL